MQDEKTSSDIIRKECSNDSFDCFGKEYIFSKRAQKYGRWVNLLKVFGVLTPSMIGITVLSYDYDTHKLILSTIISIAVFIMIIQFGFSIFAIIYKWDDELSYSFEASQDYSNLYGRFKKLGQIPPGQFGDLKSQFELLSTEYRSRELQDAKHNIKEWELRRGMRWALREYQRQCIGCNQKVVSMNSTECDVCGKFSIKQRLKSIFSL